MESQERYQGPRPAAPAADATSANAHDGAVRSLCSVGEGMVASGGKDGAVRVWSTKDGQLLHEMRRGAAEGAEGGSGGGDEKAAHDYGVFALPSR